MYPNWPTVELGRTVVLAVILAVANENALDSLPCTESLAELKLRIEQVRTFPGRICGIGKEARASSNGATLGAQRLLHRPKVFCTARTTAKVNLSYYLRSRG